MVVNVAMVTPWHVHCGIATYTEALSMALSKQDVNVYVCRYPRFGSRTGRLVANVALSVPGDKVDLIHVMHEYGLFINLEKAFYPALKSLGKPIITTMHAVGAWEVDKLVNAFSDRIVVHNEFCFKRFAVDQTDKLGIIPHGAEPLSEPPPPKEECKKSIQLQAKAPIVGYLGFISPYKSIETLIEAMRTVKRTGLLIGGGWHTQEEPEYITNLRNLALQVLPARCRWLGYVSDSDMDRVYGAMDVFVYPSRFATESGALITALSHGKAVIASDLAPFREKKDVLMLFKSVKDLSRKIRQLLKDETLRRGLEAKALEYAKRTSWEEVAKRHINLYKDVLSQ